MKEEGKRTLDEHDILNQHYFIVGDYYNLNSEVWGKFSSYH